MTRFPASCGLALALALGLAGCESTQSARPIGHTTMPLDYEARHPIFLARVTETTSVEAGVHSRGVSGVQAAEVLSFARAYRESGEGSIAVSVPSGTANARAAANVSREVRGILHTAGVPAAAVAVRPYRAEPGTLSPPVVLTFTRLRAAVPHRCRVDTDMDMGPDRAPWRNYGCAVQTNLAAMVANPNDLSTPRPMDQPSATRRNTALDRYGQALDPSTTYRNENRGTVSRVAQ
jgi:pilus assembly protein CpaD